MAEIDVRGQRIYLEDRGSGPPVLLLHSSGMASRQWRRLISTLVPNFHVLAPDFIGYGRSAPWSGEGEFHYSTDAYVAESVALSVGAPVHLVGHSYGGFIALSIAASGRVPVASLSLFDPVAFGVLYSTGDRVGIDAIESVDAKGDFFAPELKGTEAWCERFVDFWGERGYWSRLPDPMKQTFLASGRKMFEEVRSLVLDRTPHEAYARITAPTLLMTGSDTPLAEHRALDVLARTIPRARLVSLEGAGHMAPLTHASQVDALIVGNIEEVAGGRGPVG